MDKPTWGGKRSNAGRPEKSGAYGEKVSSISVPYSYREKLRFFLDAYKKERKKIKENSNFSDAEKKKYLDELGLFESWLKKSGFRARNEVIEVNFDSGKKYRNYLQPVAATPEVSPFEQISDDVSYEEISLGDPKDTYMLKVAGNSMVDLEIYEGDTLVVEKNMDGEEPSNGTIVIADILTQGTVVKIFHRESREKVILFSANDENQPIILKGEEQESLIIRSLVKNIIKPVTKIEPSRYLKKER